MIFVCRMVVAANTAEGARIRETIETPLPVVRDVQIIFEGSKVDAGIRILDRESLFVPAQGSTEEWVRHNAQPVEISMLHYKLQQEPFEIQIEAYNNGQAEIDIDIYLTCEAWDPEEILLNEIRGLRGDIEKVLGADKGPGEAAA